jgi:hypothetical protein
LELKLFLEEETAIYTFCAGTIKKEALCQL